MKLKYLVILFLVSSTLLHAPSAYQIAQQIPFAGHTGQVKYIKFSPDGTKIITISGDYTAKIWTISGQCLETIEDTRSPITSAAFSPDSTEIVVATGNTAWRPSLDAWLRIIKKHFSDKKLPLKQQAVLVTLDSIARGIIRRPRYGINHLLESLPQTVRTALKNVYRIRE